MISLVATLIFFVLLFHAFYNSIPACPSHYSTTKHVVVSKFLLRKRGIDVARVDAVKLTSSTSEIEVSAVQFSGKKVSSRTGPCFPGNSGSSPGKNCPHVAA